MWFIDIGLRRTVFLQASLVVEVNFADFGSCQPAHIQLKSDRIYASLSQLLNGRALPQRGQCVFSPAGTICFGDVCHVPPTNQLVDCLPDIVATFSDELPVVVRPRMQHALVPNYGRVRAVTYFGQAVLLLGTGFAVFVLVDGKMSSLMIAVVLPFVKRSVPC
ncbi:hypothetical protein PAXRUDRAFT_23732 [Paxillus rubicundulus Ve08.2h10]|uniref:Uncharacterized protein n=1 Tax=Paxillus rubicundulus Ve08.2h10 TaxID=930991 RepID=A0A0D0E4S4_9AGAM|nr:hypothetical protein PAXRUDRAFT_23732 [Paxillus rubicundulus Ve08.2h10]